MANVPPGLVPWGPENPPPPAHMRRKTIGQIIRKHTKSGEELAMFALRIIRGEQVASYQQRNPITGIVTFVDGPPPLQEQLRALEFLARYSHRPATEKVEDNVRAELADVFARVREKLAPEVYKVLVTSLVEANEDELQQQVQGPENEGNNGTEPQAVT